MSRDNLVLFLLKLFPGWYRRRKPKSHTWADIPDEEGADIHIRQGRKFSLRELQIATNDFNQNNALSPYGFDKVVYKGLLADGSLVAVKRFKKETGELLLGFHTEVEIINNASHRYVIQLLGYCITSKELLVVYPLMVNGSVASCLRERPDSQPPLNWPVRRRIAVMSAKGLAYLHEECRLKIIHRDIKAANILLNDDFEAVIADFELAKTADHYDTEITTTVCGTIGHMAPEYLATGRFTEKTDVYAYGVFLLELITGQRARNLALLADDEDIWLPDLVKRFLQERKLEMIIDTDLQGNYTDEEVEQFLQLALLCTQSAPEERPKMSEIVMMLEDGDRLSNRWKYARL